MHLMAMTALSKWMGDQKIGDAELARRLGRSRSQVTRLRNGSSRPSPETAAALEGVTGIPAWEFIAAAVMAAPSSRAREG